PEDRQWLYRLLWRSRDLKLFSTPDQDVVETQFSTYLMSLRTYLFRTVYSRKGVHPRPSFAIYSDIGNSLSIFSLANDREQFSRINLAAIASLEDVINLSREVAMSRYLLFLRKSIDIRPLTSFESRTDADLVQSDAILRKIEDAYLRVRPKVGPAE